MTAYEIYKLGKVLNLSKEEFKKLLIEKHIIIQKPKEMGKIIELLDKLREFVISEFGKDEIIAYYENYHLNKKGLCFCAQLMYRNKIIDKENLKILMGFLTLNKPELDEFNREWGWYPGLYHPRIKWIEDQIKLLKAVI
jgi:hypothetical protein